MTTWPIGGRAGKAGGVWGGLFCRVIEAIPRFIAALASIAVVILLDPFYENLALSTEQFTFSKRVAKLSVFLQLTHVVPIIVFIISNSRGLKR